MIRLLCNDLLLYRFYILTAIQLVQNAAMNDDILQECPVRENENRLLEAYCSNRGLPLIPNKIPAYIQVLDLSDNYNLRFTPNAFRRYGQTLIHLKLSRISDMAAQKSRNLAPLDVFLTLYKLEILEFTYSNLTDDEMWRFPATLRKLIVDGNNYTKLDVSTSYKLEEISANDNKLKRLPIVFQPPHTLTKYRLKNNPLDQFTINDLAPLCNLNILELEIPQGTFLTSPIGSCRCQQIMKWTKLFNISGAYLDCSNLTDSKCDFNFDEYIKLRKVCPKSKDTSISTQTRIVEIYDTNITNTVSKKLPNENNYSNVIIGFLLTCVVAFIIYKLVIRFRRHSASASRRRKSKTKKKKRRPMEVEHVEEEDDEIGHRF